RILVIPSVDGLSVLDGKAASHESQGYVIGPRQVLRVPGWKVNGETAAQFTFQKVGSNQTYSEQMNTGTTSGVVGFMIFCEKQQTIWHSTREHSTREIKTSGRVMRSHSLGSFNSGTKTLGVGSLDSARGIAPSNYADAYAVGAASAPEEISSE